MRRFMFLFHRWSGIAMALLVLAWFVSGIVLMYVPFPELTRAERLSAMTPIDTGKLRVDLPELLSIANANASAERVSLYGLAGRLVWRLDWPGGESLSIDAQTGARLVPNSTFALAVARDFGGAPVTEMEQVDVDQWSVSSSLHSHRPLYRARIDDGRGTVLYISSRTGEVVRDTHATERRLNWIGALIHWIYPVQLRRHQELWTQVVIYLSLIALAAACSGAFIGILRLRPKRRYRDGDISPYRGIYLWHHWLGLGFGILVLSFLFSGLMSMNPWGVFDGGSAQQLQGWRYQVGLSGAVEPPGAKPLLAAYPELARSVRINWSRISDSHVVTATDRHGDRIVLSGSDRGNLRTGLPQEQVVRAAANLLPAVPVAAVEVVREYDNYYYPRHNDFRPLPAIRIDYADAAKTRVYLDAATGEILRSFNRTDRWERWLYNGLHSLDFRILLGNRPWWDLVVLGLSIIGIVFAATAVSIGWRRLNIKCFGYRRSRDSGAPQWRQ